MTQMPKVSDEGNSQKLVYDAWNRLVQVKDSGDTVIVTYRYNGLHHRVRKLLGSNPSSPTTTYDDYYNAGWQVLEQRKDSDVDPYAQYIWDLRYIDAPVVRFRDSNTDGTLDDTLYHLNDVNMNVTALVDASSGGVVERYAYDPYGKVAIFDNAWTSRGSSSYDNQILYCGYRYDGETGLYHVRYRMYHPTLGRWMQRDPLGYPDGMTLYAYVGNHPTRAVDPGGSAKVEVKLTTTTVDGIGYWNKVTKTKSVWGQTNAAWTITANCECTGKKGKCYRITDVTLSIEPFIILDRDKIAKDDLTLPGVYGHEQRHVAMLIKKFQDHHKAIKDALARTSLGRSDQEWTNEQTCNRYRRRWVRDAYETAELKRQMRVFALDSLQHSTKEDGGHPVEKKEYDPTGDVNSHGDHGDEGTPNQGALLNDIVQ